MILLNVYFLITGNIPYVPPSLACAPRYCPAISRRTFYVRASQRVITHNSNTALLISPTHVTPFTPSSLVRTIHILHTISTPRNIILSHRLPYRPLPRPHSITRAPRPPVIGNALTVILVLVLVVIIIRGWTLIIESWPVIVLVGSGRRGVGRVVTILGALCPDDCFLEGFDGVDAACGYHGCLEYTHGCCGVMVVLYWSLGLSVAKVRGSDEGIREIGLM